MRFVLDDNKKRETFEYEKIHGLPVKGKEQGIAIHTIDKSIIDVQAENETIAIQHSYKGKTMDFGKRLKSKFILSDYSSKPKAIPTRYVYKNIEEKKIIKHRKFEL